MGLMGAQQPTAKPLSYAATVLRPRFIAHRRDDVVTIRSCLVDGDFETIARLGHNMRGNGPSYGFPDLAEIGERLEYAARVKNADLVREQLRELDAWLLRVGEPERRTQSGTHRRADR
jgi:HPt (histidine-containing phosphotransfer) domain-containing protein